MGPGLPGETLCLGATGTRLHPITQLVLLAIALRLAADLIDLADWGHAYANHLDGLEPGWFWPRQFGKQEREIAQAVIYFGDAAMIEGLSRVWRALRDQRLGHLGNRA